MSIMPASGPANPKTKRRTTSPEEVLSPTVLYCGDSEKAVIGCCLAQPNEVMPEASSCLQIEDFFVPAYQEIYRVLLKMYDGGRAIDAMTVHQKLVDEKLADRVGSPGILAEVYIAFASHLNFKAYALRVKEKSLLRSLQAACTKIVEDIAEMPDTVSSVMDRAEAQIMAVTQTGLTTQNFREPGVAMDEEVDRIIAYDGRRPFVGIPSGFHKLDELTAGWKPGEMIVLAARPGQGKTNLALDFMHASASSRWDEKKDAWQIPGYPVAMINLEMPENQLELRRLSKKSGIPMQRLRIGLTDDQERRILCNSREEMRSWPVIIRDVCYLTIGQCRSLARKLKIKYKIELLVIDYLQLMSDVKNAKDYNRQVEVANISRGIKALAKELQIPIIILAQLNRKSEEANRPPALHNLRESGAIEQDADVVLLLHRQEAQKDGAGNEIVTPIVEYNLAIAKQRNGPCDDIKILFNSRYCRFDDPVRNGK